MTHAAQAGAVLAGFSMLTVITLYAEGRFAGRRRTAAAAEVPEAASDG